jgi:hypothetical protein
MNEEIDTINPVKVEDTPTEPAATLHGNAYDLTAVGALASGGILLFMCLTCNMGFYCLPFLPLILGVIGVISAKRAVNREQSQAMAWVGLGSGVLVILLILAGVILYFGLVALIILAEG